jgi:predicted dehydrogenase
MQMTRREVMTATLASITAAGLPDWYTNSAYATELERDSAEPNRYGANDQINIAVIGPGGRKGGFQQGLGDTHNAARKPGVKIVAACDVDKTHAEDAAKSFGPDCKIYYDFREVLARPDIDAVVIGTPDHWHAIIAVAAMKAGKDVYCEKPMTLRIEEGKRIVRVAKDKKRVFQTGSQQRSDARFRLACELVRNGRIGKLKKAIAHLPSGPVGGPFEVKPVPADFDYEFWLGPAPEADYVFERTHGSFRHWLDHSGGMLTDWGAHHNDISQWGIGADGSGPISVEAVGRAGMVGKNCYNTFPEFDVTYTYENGVTLLSTSRGENGVDFEGETGSIFVSRGTIRASDPELLTTALPADATRLYASNDHMQNWIDCIRKREQPICNAEVGHRSVTTCHLANISLRLGGKKLDWDPKRERFTNSKEANEMAKYHYRGGWKL